MPDLPLSNICKKVFEDSNCDGTLIANRLVIRCTKCTRKALLTAYEGEEPIKSY